MRRRRYDSWDQRPWGKRWYVLRNSVPVSRAEQRQALSRLATYMALVWAACAVMFYLWARSVGPGFDDGSPVGWEKGITTGDAGKRAAALFALSESNMLPRVSCRILGERLADTIVVRDAAVSTLIKTVREGRCAAVVIRELATAPASDTREAAARVLSGAGPAVRGSAVEPLIRALERDSSIRGAAATALASIGDATVSVHRALERALETSHGSARGEVLEALNELFPPKPEVRPCRGLKSTAQRRASSVC